MSVCLFVEMVPKFVSGPAGGHLVCATMEAEKEECFLETETLGNQKTEIQTVSLIKMSKISLGKVWCSSPFF